MQRCCWQRARSTSLPSPCCWPSTRWCAALRPTLPRRALDRRRASPHRLPSSLLPSMLFVAAGIPDRDVEDQFAKYGRLRSCWVARKPHGFGFGE